ncbi:hypothetical protein Pint_34482 [Pistacia integerrima]|uniref:Uncharacterized protein n=1 Tax=Pistacia integerrima TaxID=434235 RepID=A0ACC0X6T0_9ROSI|nr:hypothetical protein Pint_34482 [Pistacia integerrima]
MRRNSSSKNDEIENVPVNPGDSFSSQSTSSTDLFRPPLNTLNPKLEHEPTSTTTRTRIDKTPTKPIKPRNADQGLPLRTPDKHGMGFSSKHRFGWANKNDNSTGPSELRDDSKSMTPRVSRGWGRRVRVIVRVIPRRGIPVTGGLPPTVVNTAEVPHFDLKEDPSFWMDHNVQDMLFRMAGLPMVENCLSGYNSCMFAYGQPSSSWGWLCLKSMLFECKEEASFPHNTNNDAVHVVHKQQQEVERHIQCLERLKNLEVRPSPHRGMTPRIFEFLFARIQAEEESRRDEKLKYNCKCSFLEIYNEQITDLLDPSSTNLMLREDVKQGVYVENLSEFEVQTVGDILKLLTQGSLNRKVAATNMNRESSRSHSVFTCVIESKWETDSTTNLRFARLNLVDLAGSERQKTSGAEGERLKEAANINKSLSTLGILLVETQKPMIIANVSPSICCAAETLNTLKFAQRAKLIQNNAVVNEDSTGDIIALQHQIRLLKEELALLKRQNVSRSLSFGSITVDTVHGREDACMDNTDEVDQHQVDHFLGYESKGIVRLSMKQLKSLETTLAGALRREQMAETSIKKLEAEIEQLNRLVWFVKEKEDTRSSKMMLRFREDKIQRMESLLGGSLPADPFLLEENRALSEEIQLLQAKVDRNPEVTRFALENIRLLDQLRRFQEFYEEGEREILLAEVSNLRNQLLQFLDDTSKQHNDTNTEIQPQEAVCVSKENNTLQLELQNAVNELESCKHKLTACLEENAKLSREMNDLRAMLNNLKSASYSQDNNTGNSKGSLGAPTFELHMLESVQNEVKALKGMHDTMERSSRVEIEERETCLNRDLELAKDQLLLMCKQYEDADRELKDAKSVIEALESQQILSINEMEDLRRSKSHYVKCLSEQELEINALKDQLFSKELRDQAPSYHLKSEDSTLQAKLNRMHDSLDKAKRLNMWYQRDRDCHVSNEEEMDEIRRQVEGETAEVIVCMQEELASLQQQVQDCNLKEMETKNNMLLLETELKELKEKLDLITANNKYLLGKLEEKDGDLRALSEEWELLASEVEEVLAHGNETLIDASDQLDLISSSFPQKRIWISEQLGQLVRIISEKDLLIEELSRCLEDANSKRSEVECMLKSLRGAALVINEAHQQECHEKGEEILPVEVRID